MGSEKEANLFNLSAGLGKARKPEKKAPSSSKSSRGSIDEETLFMIQKMRKMHNEIELKLDDAFQKTGWDKRIIQNYLDNPNNFSNNTEWERIQHERLALVDQMWKKLGKDDTSLPSISSSSSQKSKNQINKDRKTKMMGSRRNWIPMR